MIDPEENKKPSKTETVVMICFLLIIFEAAVMSYKIFTNYTANGNFIDMALFLKYLLPIIWFSLVILIIKKRINN